MANLALTVERKAFSVAIDAALKSLNKDREKRIVTDRRSYREIYGG